ncbi:hypothetical protein BAGA_19095 [Bacillus gaemokensis]|uniref:Uncharacterized protein n=1 Tax=Bacillus gaemokensis TaxID=574375 RepID=A0A073K7T6_9BACI|nr:hypothetical protein BAGA_19095 [Bacillus gaemokensis]KYG29033.1 hypothetical protein AZF08_13810 [Bacillus gaemokensis]
MKEFLSKRIRHARNRAIAIKETHGDNPNETHNYFGGHTLGYWEGKLSAYQSILDEIEYDET